MRADPASRADHTGDGIDSQGYVFGTDDELKARQAING